MKYLVWVFGMILGLLGITVLYILWKRSMVTSSLLETFEAKAKPRVAIAVMMRRPVDLFLWLKHHRTLGIDHFFLRVEDTAGMEEYLTSQSDITFEIKESDKGNNYETLQQRQIAFVNQSLEKAKKMGIQWLFHIDADELLEGSLSFLAALPPTYMCVKLENAEAVYEEKEESCFSAKKFIRCKEEGASCRSYVNGKGGGRVQKGVALAGPHDFSYQGKLNGSFTYPVPFSELHVLHYDSCTFGSWSEKFQHLGKDAKSKIPFPYYNDSIEAAVKAYEVYHNYTMKHNIDPRVLYTREKI